MTLLHLRLVMILWIFLEPQVNAAAADMDRSETHVS